MVYKHFDYSRTEFKMYYLKKNFIFKCDIMAFSQITVCSILFCTSSVSGDAAAAFVNTITAVTRNYIRLNKKKVDGIRGKIN